MRRAMVRLVMLFLLHIRLSRYNVAPASPGRDGLFTFPLR